MFKNSRKVPPLYKHQAADIDFELAHDVVFDASDPGTGKTRTRLEVFSRRRAKGVKAALVLASKSLLEAAWANDCRQFTPWLKTSCAYASNRAEAFEAKADMYITNHDAVKWLLKQPKAFFDRFDYLIVDESTAFKHHTSARSKALNKIKKYFRYRCVMSGSPNTNSVTDLWNQANILDDGVRLGASFFHFRTSVQQPEQVGRLPHMVKWVDRPGAETAVGGLLKDITIRNIFEECHDIPKNHSYIVPFKMANKHQTAYEQMERDAVLRLNTGAITAVNAAAVVTKLLQIASGAAYGDNEDYHVVNKDRYELVADLVEARKFCIVFFNWRHQKEMLEEEFKARRLTYTVIDGGVSDKKRLEAVNMFQSGFYKVLLAHPASAAHGLTLTRGTSTIWTSPTYNLEHYIQGNKRIYRAGQTQKTETVNIIAGGTIEEHVYQSMTVKNVKLMDYLEVLRK